MARVTLTFSTATLDRIRGALGESLNIPVDEVDANDYKDFVIAKTTQFVTTSEKRVAAEAAPVPPPIDDMT